MANFTKRVTNAILLFSLATGSMVAAEPVAFESFENFDNETHFSESASVPEGWKSEGTYPFARDLGSRNGISPKSGDYSFIALPSSAFGRDEVFYTPMMKLAGGKPCTISFSFYAPGGIPNVVRNNGLVVKAGTSQTADGQTIAVGTVAKAAYTVWTDYAFSFTPEVDGEYCFSVALDCSMGSSGYVALDDVTIEGYAPGEDSEDVTLEPNPDNYSSAYELPYFNTFDNYDNDYDGTNVVPTGWKSVGSTPFVTAAISGLNAVTGTYYLVAEESAYAERDDRLYTPMFRLKAGKEYTVSYYLTMPGNSNGEDVRTTSLDVTVGTEQDFDFHPLTVQYLEGQTFASFTKQEFTFTPEVSGAYCFAFSLGTTVNYCGRVAIDDFNITAPGLVAKPTANFGVGGVFELQYSSLLTYADASVNITNLSENADEYAWTVVCPDESTLTSTDETPAFVFNQSGDYEITLEVKNAGGSRSTTKSVAVQCVDSSYDGSMTTWSPKHDALLQRGSLPSFAVEGDDDSLYDFVTGYNRYYTSFAERFDMPDDVELVVNTLNVWLCYYNNRAYTSGYDSDKPFSIAFYGETDGKLDENKVFARVDKNLVDIFGNTGVGGSAGEARDVNFGALLDKPVKTKGTFYVAFEFAEDMTVKTDDAYVGRSYFGTNAVQHVTGEATLYAKPHAVPANSKVEADGNWYRIDEIDPAKKAVGAQFMLWVKGVDESTGVAVNSVGDVVFAAKVVGNTLMVSGTVAGETVAVYNVNGQMVATAVGQAEGTSVDVSHLTGGVYVVKTSAGTAKIVK